MPIEDGQTVTVNYTAKLEDGTVFDTTEDKEPLEFEIGDNRIIPGFEAAVRDMEPGDSKVAQIPPEQAFGMHDNQRVLQVPLERLPDDLDPQVGQTLEIPQEDGSAVQAVITEVNDDSITLDANHPLAGHELTFEIDLLDVQ
jgi:peptidylprolyl isomerase/FKBP-type peptidyl-prolyl cis-trans isomerase SlpA